jgi:hypothetical protein
MVKKKNQLDLSEIGEPIENSLQNSEINELNINNIINDEMITVQKSIEDIKNEIEPQVHYSNQDGYSNQDDYSGQDDYSNQDGYSNQDDYSGQDDYSNQDGYSNQDEYSNQDDYPNGNDYPNQYNYTNQEKSTYFNDEPPTNNLEILHAKQLNAKRELIYKIQQLQNKLYDVEINPKNFTTADSLTELQSEFDRLTIIKNQKSTRDWYRKILFGVTKGLEWCNHKWDPVGLKLDGWSTEIASNADEFDEIFDELTEKYGGTFGIEKKIAPEIRLIGLILYSGVTYSISQTLTSSYNNRPEFSEIINKDPVLRERFLKTATEIQLEQAQPQVSKLYSSVKELFKEEEDTNANMRNFMTRLDNSDLQVNELDL